MPQASNDLRSLMARWFPFEADGTANTSGVDDGMPMRFLRARGWTEQGGMWSKPTASHNPSYYEVSCLLFLRDEWDHDFHKPLYYDGEES